MGLLAVEEFALEERGRGAVRGLFKVAV